MRYYTFLSPYNLNQWVAINIINPMYRKEVMRTATSRPVNGLYKITIKLNKTSSYGR